MDYNWQSCFPYPEFRDGQDAVIDKIINQFNNGKKFVMVEAPTGAGKSAIGYTIGRYFNSYYYVTAQKILQSQLSGDFGEDGTWASNKPMIELKGRNAYECNFYQRAANDPLYECSDQKREHIKKKAKDYVDCSVGECKKMRKSSLDYCHGSCPYLIQFDKAIHSPSVLMNFHSFIYQTEFVNKWSHKNLLIIDEAHNTEQVLMDYISFRFTDFDQDFNLPKFDSAEEYLIFFEDIEIRELLQANLVQAIDAGDSKKEEDCIKQIQKYCKFRESVQKHEWIPRWEQKTLKGTDRKYRIVELKPLYVRDFAHELLFDKADCVLMMSATLLNVKIVCDSLGIDKDDVWATRIASTFPVKNRPIFYKPSGSMSFKNKAETMPKLIADIEKICERHVEQRGIIHTHNFQIAEYIRENGSNELKTRLYFQNDYGSKDDMLEAHSKSENGIIIAPAMHEGLDLKEDLSRFQIICKIPFPGLGDNPQLKKRMDISSDYYQYLTALKLVQSYGRSIRSEKDWAITYVLDENFKQFCNRSPEMLPQWFKEAIKWD